MPIARIEAAARTQSTGVTRLEEATRQRREPTASRMSGPPVVLVVGTLDTKGAELRFIRDIIAGSGLRTRLVDVSTSGRAASCDVTAQEIALNHGRGGSGVFGADRGASVTAMAEAFERWLRRQGNIAGIISAGGSGGASLVAPFVWQPIQPGDLWAFAAMGVFGTAAQALLIRAFSLAEAAAVAPFGYTGLIWAGLWGALFWGTWPDVWTLVGAAMIVGAGTMIEAGDPVKLSPIRTTNAGQGFQGFWRPTA